MKRNNLPAVRDTAENREKRKVKNKNALKGGSYSLIISAVVLAILIVVNVFASALPTNLTQYDISSSQLYSITSNTKVVRLLPPIAYRQKI